MAMIFETHAHYDDEAFDEDRCTLLDGMPGAGVGHLVNVCASVDSLDKTRALTEKYPYVYGAYGIHPDDAGNLNEEILDRIRTLALGDKGVAIGEIGLDYYWNKAEKETQIYWFRRQLELAGELDLPVIIHSREAAQDTYSVMKDMEAEKIGGIVHCYSYSWEMAEKWLEMGYYFGIGGVVTFKNARKLVEVVSRLPMDRIVLETDSPYLAPVPNRGKRNDSRNLIHVAAKIGELRNLPTEEVIRITEENAARVYRVEL